MIQRTLFDNICKRFFTGKAIVIFGARQTGKTTLIKNITDKFINEGKLVLWLNGDEANTRSLFENASEAKFRSIIGKNNIIVIDEAQRIEDIGIKAKIITDNFPDVQLVLTDSSSFDLANKINEPLTGRKWEYKLYPLSFGELCDHYGFPTTLQSLPLRLIYGCYPDVVCHPGDEYQILSTLSDSYLYKDVLEWERIKHPEKLVKLLQALAYQVSGTVSYTEIGNLIQMDKATVEKYISLLEQAHVIFRLGSFNRNMRNELKFAKKVFFYDNGIRNAVINNFANVEMRDDNGKLWENYMISELIKRNAYKLRKCNSYFWRTTDKKEIDYIEEADGKLTCYEFKWNKNKKGKKITDFLATYPEATLVTITPDNYYEYLM